MGAPRTGAARRARVGRAPGVRSPWRAIALACFLVAGVCATWSAARAADRTAPAQPVTVEVIDNAFAPSTITVPPGGTIVFHNAGLSVHEVVADDSTFDSGPIEPGESWKLAVGPDETTIPIHCGIVSGMKAVIDVTRAPFEPAVGASGSATTTSPTTVAGSPFAVPGSSDGSTTASTAPPVLAMTGRDSLPLAVVAVCCLLLGAAALAFARPKPVPLLATVPRDGDDLLPARDRARRG